MRLLNTSTLQQEEFLDHRQVKYSILSHCWSQDRKDREVTYQDFLAGTNREGQGWEKIKKCCEISKEDGYEWTWVDTCCIDKSSSAELSEAINSMWKWYSFSGRCYAFLEDCSLELPLPKICKTPDFGLQDGPRSAFDVGGEWKKTLSHHELSQIDAFAASRWFTRGWTLQELLAPKEVLFYTKRRELIGKKSEMAALIAHSSGIAEAYIKKPQRLYEASVAQRMSWAACRTTSREEDRAYCLLGIFDIAMPLLYGEGGRAFMRLQEQILQISDDPTILAWGGQPYPPEQITPALTVSPSYFNGCGGLAASGSREVVTTDIVRLSMSAGRLAIITSNPTVRVYRGKGGPGGTAVLQLGEGSFLRLERQGDDDTCCEENALMFSAYMKELAGQDTDSSHHLAWPGSGQDGKNDLEVLETCTRQLDLALFECTPPAFAEDRRHDNTELQVEQIPDS
nr:hypothetical protein B0A51_00172 [Rachicladosporium sp. CCFEE 5018]